MPYRPFIRGILLALLGIYSLVLESVGSAAQRTAVAVHGTVQLGF